MNYLQHNVLDCVKYILSQGSNGMMNFIATFMDFSFSSIFSVYDYGYHYELSCSGIPKLISGHYFQDPLKNGVLSVQTIRNNIMASTLLATTAITLSSLIGVFVSSTGNSGNTASQLIYGNKSPTLSSIKYFSILLCFLVAFLCNVQSIRYYAHVSFLATIPTWQGKGESIEYVARNLNRGSLFWSFGLRAFYLSFPLFLWIFGPIPMFVCSIIMSFILYFLDTTTSFTRQLHSCSIKEGVRTSDVESVGQMNVTAAEG
ncbi:hypothetical protein FEM48_Zijuj05G0100400 [Ziziphus jujuba var. spinosa]|uniref:Transmembrane protein n=1 Tax=Ziziphus jujuba var. spinosa TaxID=714518 RepID=A0A978VEB6_ZIZJJ|nr:hypothetical protein FEM48_Zijuj05G0100400 [Ziziphus jujuba var. spinosa]